MPVNTHTPSADHAEVPPTAAPAPMSWARLLTKPPGAVNGERRPEGRKPGEGFRKRVSDIDIEQCPRCGGPLTIIAAIVDPTVIAKILKHLGLSARAPPRAPAQRFDRFRIA